MGVNPGESLDVAYLKKRASFRGQIRSLWRWLSEGSELAGWFDGGGRHAEVDGCEIEEGPLRCRTVKFDLGGLQLRGHGQRVALEYLQFRAADSRIIAGYCMYVYMFDLFIYLLVELFGG